MAGRAKENLPGGSLKYLFVYKKSVYLNVVTVVFLLVLNAGREFSGMISIQVTSNFIIPATPSNPSIPY